LDFRLKNQSGEWRVYDVVIDDASLVRNYRAQFDRIIRDYSYAGLVDAMTQRALVVKVFEKTSGTLSAGASR
jgi:phospholipid transport system substrate-binding protein